MGGGVTADIGSIFSKSCQILSPPGGEHLPLSGQLVLPLLNPRQKCMSPERAGMGDAGIPEFVSLPWGHLQGPSSLLAEMSFAPCSLAAHISAHPGPHLLHHAIFHLKNSVLLKMGTWQRWQRVFAAAGKGPHPYLRALARALPRLQQARAGS